MRDRQPTPGKAGRVRIRKDNGEIVEGVLEMADDALDTGTPYNKATQLTDQTSAKLGMSGDRTVNDAFSRVADVQSEIIAMNNSLLDDAARAKRNPLAYENSFEKLITRGL